MPAVEITSEQYQQIYLALKPMLVVHATISEDHHTLTEWGLRDSPIPLISCERWKDETGTLIRHVDLLHYPNMEDNDGH